MLTNLRDAFRGQSRSPNMVPFHMSGIVSSCAIVTLSLRRTAFPIFDFKKCIWMRGQRSLKVIERRTIRYTDNDFLLVFYRNFVLKTHHFWDIRLQKCRDLENRVRSPSKSLEMSPFDRAHTNSYIRSIVTMALSRVVSEISMSKNVVTLKSGSEVAQRHWKWYHSIDWVRFPISVL